MLRHVLLRLRKPVPFQLVPPQTPEAGAVRTAPIVYSPSCDERPVATSAVFAYNSLRRMPVITHLRARTLSWVGWVLAGLFVTGCATLHGVRSTSADLPAFIQVDDGLYRGGQPSPEGIQRLARMGVRTVISLRQPSKAMDNERQLTERLGMRWVNIPLWAWWRPSDQQIRQFLSIVRDPVNRPVFVHCLAGHNRAGMMVAIYRVVHQGWTPQQAYREARHLGLVPWNLASRALLFYEVKRVFVGTNQPPQPPSGLVINGGSSR